MFLRGRAKEDGCHKPPLPPSEAPLPPGGGYKGSSIAYIPLGGTKGAEEYNGSSIAYTPLRGAGGPKWKPAKQYWRKDEIHSYFIDTILPQMNNLI